MAKLSQSMASLKQQLLQTESQILAVRQKSRDKEQLLLYPVWIFQSNRRLFFCRQTISAFQDVLHNPVMVTKLFIEQFSSRKNVYSTLFNRKRKIFPQKIALSHLGTHITWVFSHESVRLVIGKFYNAKLWKPLCCAACSLGDTSDLGPYSQRTVWIHIPWTSHSGSSVFNENL